MTDISYVLELETRDHRGEEISWRTEAEAWEAFRKYVGADSAKLYKSIRLARIDWVDLKETTLATLTF